MLSCGSHFHVLYFVGSVLDSVIFVKERGVEGRTQMQSSKAKLDLFSKNKNKKRGCAGYQ